MKLKFTKMQGAGNDFVVLDGVRQRVRLEPEQWRFLADRHFGVGADQMLLVEPSTTPVWTFAIASSMPMAVKSNNAAMARAASCASCAIRA
jgi:diaminopimelate epimerase